MRGDEGYTSEHGDLERVPTGTLIRELVQESQHLLREEIHLAKAEAREEIRKGAKGVAAMSAGGVLLHTAFLALVAFLIGLGSTFMAWWTAALVAAVLLAAIGAFALWFGRERLNEMRPTEPLKQAKEDGRWAKQMLQSARSKRHAHA